MIGDPDGPIVVVSPHLDDAVLSAWSVLRLPPSTDVRVVVLFAGVPVAGTTGAFDPIFGVTDSAGLVRSRRQEDLDALATVGRTPTHLDLLDVQYRTEPLPVEEVTAALLGSLDAAATLVAPAGIGRHPDHLLARDAAVAVAAELGIGLAIYADLPYATNMGWPSWVTGSAPDPRLVPDAAWTSVLAQVSAPAGLDPVVTRFDPAERAAKLAALRCYESQWPALEGGPLGRISNPEVSSFELHWVVSPDA